MGEAGQRTVIEERYAPVEITVASQPAHLGILIEQECFR